MASHLYSGPLSLISLLEMQRLAQTLLGDYDRTILGRILLDNKSDNEIAVEFRYYFRSIGHVHVDADVASAHIDTLINRIVSALEQTTGIAASRAAVKIDGEVQ